MTIHFVSNAELKVALDPIESSENPQSVSFNIDAHLKMPFQESVLRIKACWISHDCLNDFQIQLSKLRHSENGKANLVNMSGAPVISIEREGNTSVVSVHSADTAGVTASTIRVNGYASELDDFHHNLDTYAKWW